MTVTPQFGAPKIPLTQEQKHEAWLNEAKVKRIAKDNEAAAAALAARDTPPDYTELPHADPPTDRG